MSVMFPEPGPDDPEHVADDRYADPRGLPETLAAGLMIAAAYLAGAATVVAAAAIAGWWRS